MTRKRAPTRAKPARGKPSIRKQAKAKPRAKPQPRATPPGPALVTQAEYARRRGVSREAVRKAVRDGRIRLADDGRLDPAAADVAWAANTDPSARPGAAVGRVPPGGPGTTAAAGSPGAAGSPTAFSEGLPDGVTYADARAIREWNQALLLEQQRRLRAGELAEVAQCVDIFYRAWRTARDLCMALPDNHDAELIVMTDRAELNARLKHELRRIFDDLSRTLSDTNVLTDLEAAS